MSFSFFRRASKTFRLRLLVFLTSLSLIVHRIVCFAVGSSIIFQHYRKRMTAQRARGQKVIEEKTGSEGLKMNNFLVFIFVSFIHLKFCHIEAFVNDLWNRSDLRAKLIFNSVQGKSVIVSD